MPGKIDKNALYVRIAKETGISKSEVKKVITEQFNFVGHTMANDNFEQIRLPYFGRFWAKEGRIKYLQEKYGKNRDKKNVGSGGHEPSGV